MNVEFAEVIIAQIQELVIVQVLQMGPLKKIVLEFVVVLQFMMIAVYVVVVMLLKTVKEFVMVQQLKIVQVFVMEQLSLMYVVTVKEAQLI